MFPKPVTRCRLLLILAIGTAASIGCRQETAVSSKYQRTIDELREMIPDQLERFGISGISISLVDDQEIVWAEGFGYADRENNVETTKNHIYRVGSISKLFTDIAVMQLQERGKLDIDTDIATYIPEFNVGRPFETDKPTTLRQLMSHSSGMLREPPVGNYFDVSEPTIKETVESIYGLDLVYPPGTKTKYSNVGIALVGYTVQRVSGMPFADYVRENILHPMGMTSSDFVKTDEIGEHLSRAYMWVSNGETAEGKHITAPVFKLGTLPAGNLYSTVEDLGGFHSFIFAGGTAGSNRIITEKTLQVMMEPQLDSEGQRGFGIGFVVGELHGHKTYGHGGAIYGFASSFVGMPDDKVGVVVLSNEDIANPTTDRIALGALRLLLEEKTGETLPEPEKPVQLDPNVLTDFTGTYQSSGYWVKVFQREGKLYGDFSGQEAEMEALSETDFAFKGRAVSGKMSFTRAEDGEVAGLTSDGLAYTPLDPEQRFTYPESWDRLLGWYGPEFIPLIITKKYGNLYAFVENLADYRLEPISDTVFKFNYGLYEGENLEFVLGPGGEVEEAVMANVGFEPLAR